MPSLEDFYRFVQAGTNNDTNKQLLGYDNDSSGVAKFRAYINYVDDASGVTIFTNGLPNYVPSLFGQKMEIDPSKLYEDSQLAVDDNSNGITFKYCRYRLAWPNEDLKDARFYEDPPNYGMLSPFGSIGVSVNGVAMYNSLASPDLKTSSGEPITWGGPGGPEILTRILDGETLYYPDGVNLAEQYSSCCGRNSNSQYNYRKLPYCVNGSSALDPSIDGYYTDVGAVYNHYKSNNDSNVHSPILGWMLDGFPVYGPIGYKYIYDGSGENMTVSTTNPIKQTVFKRSSYDKVAVSTTMAIQLGNQKSYYPSFQYNKSHIDTDPDGVYLDHCNGIFGPTPEYPDGIYHYHMTIKVDPSGNPAKGVDYFYPYDVDDMIDLTGHEQIRNYIHANLEDPGDVLRSISGNTYLKWSEYLKVIYAKDRNSNTHMYSARVPDPTNPDDFNKYHNFDKWVNDGLQGGLLSFWLRDSKGADGTGDGLGYRSLKNKFPGVFDKFESIVPEFPYITNLYRGPVTGNELKYLTTSDPQDELDAWTAAWDSLTEDQRQI